MSLDAEMVEIAKVFFQECREGLDAMESGLLDLGNSADIESINTIFRAAHSIKGGSATFDFSEVADFTHGLETLLDEMRSGVRMITPDAVQIMLHACDCLREMIAATETEQPLNMARIEALKRDIMHILAEPPGADAPGAEPPPVSAAASSPATGIGAVRKGAAEPGSIRVSTEKVDNIMNLVGELLITQSMLSGFAAGIEPGELGRLRQGLTQLARNTRELQESVMQIRMLPIGFVFNRFPRIVHDLSRQLGKKVELRLTGEATELDKTVLEKINDPLVHLVRNALDHGLETPARRLEIGKSESGTIELGAFHEGGNIIIEVRDDGAGLNKAKILQKARERSLLLPDQALSDEQIDNLIFLPGFSTAEAVSETSGRGVGMDVVRRNINDLGGDVQIVSREGRGSTIRIRLPLTLAILDGQLVRVGTEVYIISLLCIVETIQVDIGRLNTMVGHTEVFRLRDEYLPVVKLCDHFCVVPDSRNVADGLLIIVEADGHRVGVLVDDLLAQQQVVIKSLESNFKSVNGIAGATILGDGAVALIIDVPALIRSVVKPGGRTAIAA